MRELKFRVWDSEYKEMLYNGNMLSQEDGRVYANYKIGVIKAFSPNCYTVMQYIGLNDKNGKNIFEGDIVEFDDSLTNSRPVKGIGEIVFCKDLNLVRAPSYCIHFLKPTQGIHTNMWGDIKVIGNVFENPELL